MPVHATQIISLLVLGLLLVFPVACAPSGQLTPSLPEAEANKGPQRGGKLSLVGSITGPGHNDLQLVITNAGRDWAVPVVNGLLKRDIYDSNYPIVGDLAKSWDISADGLTYTLKLHQGVKWQNIPPVNGREFTSEDAKYSLLRMAADPSIVPEKDKPKFQRQLDFAPIKGIDTPDKYTAVLHLKEPMIPLLDAVSHAASGMAPKELVDEQGGIITNKMIGTGPFMVADYRQDQAVQYKRNPEYWQKGLPHLDELSMLRFADIQAELAAFRSFQLDIPGTGHTKTAVDTLKRNMPDIKVKSDTPRLAVRNFRFNMKFAPFQDLRVRRAIHLAIDRETFLEVGAEGLGYVAGAVTPMYKDVANPSEWILSQPGYRKDKSQDIAEAKRLMAEAGYSDGLNFSILVSNSSAMTDAAALLADQLKPLKINMKTDVEEYAIWLGRSNQGNFELSHMSHTMNADADSVLSAHIHSKGGRNYGKFSDPILDDLIDKQRRTANIEERRRLVQEAEKRVMEQAPLVFLYVANSILVTQPWVNDFTIGTVPGDQFLSLPKAWVEKR